ncbi:methyltransferase family protein [Marinicella sp. W31]|uniref:methyltransferase family protein n=1 Tax=Marinicella sp. W31 TaxID=3023713 RepID=UPI003757D59A
MRSLALKIPPVAVVILTMLAMKGCQRWLPITQFEFSGQKALMIVITIIAVIIIAIAMLAFNKHQTTVNPTDPEQASSLITSGIFNYSRNPIYLAFALILFAWGLRLGHGIALLWVPTFVAYMHYFQIKPEEHILLNKFGKPFAEYCQRVRRWI